MVGLLKVVASLGAGGFSEVYLAVLDYSEEPFAIKILSPSFLDNEDVKRRFDREASASSVRQLRHPNICTVFNHGKHGDTPYILMEYILGETLRTKISRMGERTQDWKEWLDIVIQIVEGLAEAHRRGVIHRDIKPENIIITPKRVAKILDFGLFRLEVPFNQVLRSSASTLLEPTERGKQLGTYAYMSPEQVREAPRVAEAGDVFSLGTVLYEVFSLGMHPFKKPTRDATVAAIASETPQELRRVNRAVPRKLQAIIDKMLQKDETRRYTTESLLRDLRRLQSRPTTLRGWFKKYARLAALILLIFAVIAAVIYHALTATNS